MAELRTPIQADLILYTAWALDPAITALDPPAGVVRDPLIWSIYSDGFCIGTVTIYNKVGRSAELGIRIGDKRYWGQGHGSQAIKEVLWYCQQQNFSSINLKVLPTNLRAIKCYMKCGFVKKGLVVVDDIEFLNMEVTMQEQQYS